MTTTFQCIVYSCPANAKLFCKCILPFPYFPVLPVFTNKESGCESVRPWSFFYEVHISKLVFFCSLLDVAAFKRIEVFVFLCVVQNLNGSLYVVHF